MIKGFMRKEAQALSFVVLTRIRNQTKENTMTPCTLMLPIASELQGVSECSGSGYEYKMVDNLYPSHMSGVPTLLSSQFYVQRLVFKEQHHCCHHLQHAICP